jgi:hypothetical protein
MDRDDRDIMFSVLPVANRYIAAINRETGMVKAIIAVALQRPINKRTIRTTKISANNKVSERFPIAPLTKSD